MFNINIYHGSKAFEGCPICPIHNGLPNWWRFVTTCYHLSVRNMSTIEYCPLHVYECLWRHYFRTILLHFFPCLFILCAGFRNPSRTVILFDDPVGIGCIGHVWGFWVKSVRTYFGRLQRMCVGSYMQVFTIAQCTVLNCLPVLECLIMYLW